MLNQVTEHLQGSQITDVSHIKSDITLAIGDVRLWVDTPWRIEREGVIWLGNDNLVEWLSHEDYRDDYEEAVGLIREQLTEATIAEVRYTDFNEPILQLDNGCVLRSFQTYGDDAENFQLYVGKRRYLVYPDRVDLENLPDLYGS